MRRVLIVEDEGIVAEELRERVQDMGLAVVGVVARAEDVVSQASRTRPDLILMDIRLQGQMDGIEASAAIRQESEVPVIYITAHSDVATVDRARRTYPSGYLIKPFAERSLHVAIELALDRWSLERTRNDRERRFAAALMAFDDGVVLADAAGDVVFMNPAAEALTGWSVDDATGHAFDDVVRLLDPDTGEPLWSALVRVRSESGDSSLTRARLVDREGRETRVDVVHARAHDAGRRAHGAVAILRRAVTPIRDARTDGRGAPGAEAAEALTRLAAGVVHNINNRLTVIMGYADLLLRELGADTDRRHHKYVAEIRDSGERAADVTRQLNAFTRQQPLVLATYDLNDVVASFEPRLREIAGGSVAASTALAPLPCPVRVDRRQLEHVLVNLTRNACEAMPAGGRLLLETRRPAAAEPRQRSADDPHGDFVTLVVTDTGVGMDADTRRQLFQPFFTTRPAAEGRGLGLSTVYGIVSQFGGFILVHSEPGEGTRFEVFLPESRSESTADGSATARAAAIHVLLIEPDDALRALMSAVLEADGCAVTAVPDAGDAQRRGASRRLDLLIADASSDDAEVVQAAAVLAARHPGLKVVLISDQSEPRALQEYGRRVGAQFLQKPFLSGGLLSAVRRALA